MEYRKKIINTMPLVIGGVLIFTGALLLLFKYNKNSIVVTDCPPISESAISSITLEDFNNLSIGGYELRNLIAWMATKGPELTVTVMFEDKIIWTYENTRGFPYATAIPFRLIIPTLSFDCSVLKDADGNITEIIFNGKSK